MAVSRTRLSNIGALLALVVPTLAVVLLGADSVERVSESGTIPSGFPLPHLPDLGALRFGVVTGGLAVAAIVLVQGAGVRESVRNPDGPSDANTDFVAQGIGNIASSLFRGIPVGGSVGETALNVTGGARSRWGSIFAGVWMLLILVLFGGVVGKVAMPTLAGILIFAAISSLQLGQVRTIMRTGATSQVAVVATFIATLRCPSLPRSVSASPCR